MRKFDQKKECIVEKLMCHLLKHGMSNSSIRQLAKAADVSDRMLLHYFENKEEVIKIVMFKLTDQLINALNVNMKKLAFKDFIDYAIKVISDDETRKYTRMALELATNTVDGEEYCKDIAKKIFANFFDWINECIEETNEEEKLKQVSMAYVIIEGLVILDRVGVAEKLNITSDLFA